MRSKGALSSSFNMSLGFIPVIITILLSEFITQNVAIYIGTVIGVFGTFYNVSLQTIKIPNFILYLTTTILCLLSIYTFIPGHSIAPWVLALTLEVSILIPMMILFQHKRRFINYFATKRSSYMRRFFTQGANSSIVSARLVLILGSIHFLIISISVLYNGERLPEKTEIIYFTYLPLAVFTLALILNQISIRYFNKMMSCLEYVPIVNTKGSVIGKSLAVEALSYKNNYINPVIRIAICVKGEIFLCKRSLKRSFDRSKMDFPIESYLRLNETLSSSIKRIMKQNFPHVKGLQPTFSEFYHFENKFTNRLNYLFLLELEDESILETPHFKEGKLWNFKHIEENLNQGIFGECFEKEYEFLKMIIDTREKYKVS